MNVDDAIKTAMDYVQRLFSGTAYRLEEVETKDDGGFEITVSFRAPDSRPEFMGLDTESGFTSIGRGQRAAIGVDAARTYKEVTIDKDGQVKSVRIRQIVVG